MTNQSTNEQNGEAGSNSFWNRKNLDTKSLVTFVLAFGVVIVALFYINRGDNGKAYDICERDRAADKVYFIQRLDKKDADAAEERRINDSIKNTLYAEISRLNGLLNYKKAIDDIKNN